MKRAVPASYRAYFYFHYYYFYYCYDSASVVVDCFCLFVCLAVSYLSLPVLSLRATLPASWKFRLQISSPSSDLSFLSIPSHFHPARQSEAIESRAAGNGLKHILPSSPFNPYFYRCVAACWVVVVVEEVVAE